MKNIYIPLIIAIQALISIPAKAQDPVDYGEFQYHFMATISDYANKYKSADNELQKSSLLSERHESFRKLKGNPNKVKDWIGVIEKMGTNGDGKAYVTISLSPNLLTVSTWNNSISDFQDKTLIPQSSATYKSLSQMKEGNFVKFSGKLMRPTNMTEAGKMVEPNFLFKFTSIEKIANSASEVKWKQVSKK